LREAKAELRTEISPSLPSALADPQHITQVFSNLIQNAAQAVAPGGTVTVSAREAGDEVAICVADDGPGIPDADMPRVFQPFFTTKHIGTGLGLSIVQRILAAHGGRCEVGRGPDGGAAFTVYLRSGGAGNGAGPAGVGPGADAPGGPGHPGSE
jgi:signal transduction histidine kinase